MAALYRKGISKKYLVTISQYGEIDMEYVSELLGEGWKIDELTGWQDDEKCQMIGNMKYRYVLYGTGDKSGGRNVTASNIADMDIYGNAIFCEDYEIYRDSLNI